MLTRDYKIKIADYGYMMNKEGRNSTGWIESNVGTPNYKAPELILGKKYQGSQVDIFALGVTLFATLTGQMPFERATKTDTYYKYLMQSVPEPEKFWDAH